MLADELDDLGLFIERSPALLAKILAVSFAPDLSGEKTSEPRILRAVEGIAISHPVLLLHGHDKRPRDAADRKPPLGRWLR